MKTRAIDPYPGLRPFLESEAHLFFGREEHTEELRRRLANGFLAVVGTSGSGKSSLVRAGLVAEVKAERQTEWRIAELRPGSSPIVHLAQALSTALKKERSALFSDLAPELLEEALTGDRAYLLATLRCGPLGLVELLRESPLPAGVRLLVFVDQFEEIFRFRREGAACPEGRTTGHTRSDESESFVALLLETARHPETKCVDVLLTMRSDYLGDCAVFSGLPESDRPLTIPDTATHARAARRGHRGSRA
jgi:hypothetical protein